MEELKYYGHQHPLLMLNEEQLIDNGNGIVDCSRCGEKVSAPCFSCVECCGCYLHKTCAEAPLELNHPFHRHHPLVLLQNPPSSYTRHPLVLQFNSERLSCKVCQVTQQRGIVYGCSPCKLAIHIDCASPLPAIEYKSHQHQFTLFWRQNPFICDACGTEGHHVAYTCGTCSIMVHKKCISLPRIIRHKLHIHRLFHKYFIHKEYFESLNCRWCHEVVDTEYGSYFCADCNVIFHVNCVFKKQEWYCIVSQENEEDKSLDIPVNSITKVLERNDDGEATVIEHFKHKHYLMLSDNIREHGDKCCDGCLLLISAKFYHCSGCDFFLHKSCAELPKIRLFSVHVYCEEEPFSGSKPLILTSDCMFKCDGCGYLSNGFSYKCNKCGFDMCLRCAALVLQDAVKIPGHKHPILYYYDYEGQCSACGRGTISAISCKDCNFDLCGSCVMRHKCDEHLLTLTYDKINDYTKYHYCDICEKERDPKHWFYYCETCDISTHVDCVLGGYPFIKLGSTYNERNHEHPLTFVKKIHYYPECVKCGKPCEDLSLECAEPGCNYIAHWKCRKLATRGRY
ncbi:hypothetical protein ES319_A13G007600v1 [Gossypium barbadense]|uniref:Phorbol-ester/DAG-type domain-containing protein n=1 Tax=Gossypium barbadense TaxID=3634 RepID=A0A5J5SYY9_GOSBA|nr:hypothetical protein ES319_A13G007600v1 [Gossypium barbadense]